MKANEIYEEDLQEEPENIDKYFEDFLNQYFILGERISFRIDSRDPRVVLKRIRSEIRRASFQLISN